METCPKCGAKFPARAGAGYATLTVFRGGALDTKIRCPECEHIFQPSTGLLRPGVMKFVFAFLVVIAVSIVAYLLVLKQLVG